MSAYDSNSCNTQYYDKLDLLNSRENINSINKHSLALNSVSMMKFIS